MKKYIGDISVQDAALLEHYASKARSVLEFGVGGSTHVIAQSVASGVPFLSLDTHDGWIETTRGNLRRLGVEDRCRMAPYKDWPPDTARFDMIFDDGADDLRLDFALRSFPLLAVGGVMLFHDTRRPGDIRNVLAVVEAFFEHIEHVHLNERFNGVSSNITVIQKKSQEPYVNWHAVEGKPSWAYGHAVAPEDFLSK